MTELMLVISEDMSLVMESRASDEVTHCDPLAHIQLVWPALAHGITWCRSHDVSGSQPLGQSFFRDSPIVSPQTHSKQPAVAPAPAAWFAYLSIFKTLTSWLRQDTRTPQVM